jgi:predicted metalloprotease
MDIRGRRRSTNVEDRRGMRVGRPALGIGLGGLVIMLVLSLLGINPLPFMAGLQEAQQQNPQIQPGDQPYQEGAEEAALREMTEVVLADTEDTWSQLLPAYGVDYQVPTLVLFNEAVQSECGGASSATGPFYCPLDQKVYLDMSFYRDLHERFGAPGDFAQAYVIAHEVGHHVQNLVGTARQVRERQSAASSQAEANDLSVRMELQADCFAGVWAATAQRSRQLLSAGDVDEALGAAAAIGDDRIQRQMQGHVVPDSFTHGSGEQRQRWFLQGFQAGSPDACDSFNTRTL